jgi:hypothetical protein
MGDGHNQWGHYQSAVEIFNGAIDRYTECGLLLLLRLLGLVQSWNGMSVALMAMGKVDLAAKSIEEAYKFSSLMPEGEIKMTCLQTCNEHKRKLASIVMINRDV